MPVIQDLSGIRYGTLTAIKRIGKTKFNLSVWLCKCDCGKEKEVISGNLKTGNTTNCGCKRREIAKKISQKREIGGFKNPSWRGGKPKCIDCGVEISYVSKRCVACSALNKVGINNVNWKGGVTSVNKKIRTSLRYKNWRSAVFERDNWTCQECGKRGIYIEAHHLKPFSLYSEIRFDLNNGITLCRNCHSLTDTYCGKIKKYARDNIQTQ